MSDLGWILLFYGVGIAAMFIELFIPGAIIGITGFVTVCGSIIYAYTSGHGIVGTILVGTTVAFIPVFFILWKNVLGRVLSVRDSEKGFRPSTARHEELLGKEGHAAAPLRPSGTALIEGKRYAVISRGELLAKGTRVKVIDVSGNRITVKKV